MEGAVLRSTIHAEAAERVSYLDCFDALRVEISGVEFLRIISERNAHNSSTDLAYIILRNSFRRVARRSIPEPAAVLSGLSL